MPPDSIHSEQTISAAPTPPALPTANDLAFQFYTVGQQAEQERDTATAIEAYQGALKLDPALALARTALGRLTYQHPLQPFMEEAKRLVPFEICEVVIEVRNPCNYRCYYCLADHNNEPVREFNPEKIEKAYQQLDKNMLLITTFECGGGEPTVHPQLPDILEIACRYGYASLPTNISQNPERWLPKAHADRLVVISSLHPEAEEDLEKYIRHAHQIKNSGAQMDCQYICHPRRIHNYPALRERFDREGLTFDAVPFVGSYCGERYPFAHTDEHKAIMRLDESSKDWLRQIEPELARIRNFEGIPCRAGRNMVYIGRDGTLSRCAYDRRKMDAQLSQASPCAVKHCGCGIKLDKINTYEPAFLFLTWAKKMGLTASPLIDFDGIAKKHGYCSAQAAMAEEQLRAYNALMAAYGKDDYPEKIKR